MQYIFILTLFLSFYGQSQENDYLKQTQEATDRNIEKLINERLYDLGKLNLEELIEAINKSDNSFDLSPLYEQFIFYRHSSPELNLAVYKNKIRTLHHTLHQQLYPSFREISDNLGMRDRVLPSYKKSLNTFKSMLKTDNSPGEKELSFPKNLIPEKADDYHHSKKVLASFCQLNYPLAIKTCQYFLKILDRIDMRVGETGLLMRPDSLNILPKLALKKPLAEVSLKIIEIIENIEQGAKLPSGDIKSLLMNTFIDHGYTQAQAHEYFMAIMALYGQRGASWDVTFAAWAREYHSKGNALPHRVFMSSMELGLIFSGISVIDKYLWKEEKRHFSIPQSIRSEHVIGKPYYFWMSAYFADDLKKVFPNLARKNIVQAIQLLNQSYQLEAEFNGRNPFIFYEEEVMSTTSHQKRVDMLSSFSGALYGHDDQSKLNLNSAFNSMFKDVEAVPRDYGIGTWDYVQDKKVSHQVLVDSKSEVIANPEKSKVIIKKDKKYYLADFNQPDKKVEINIPTHIDDIYVSNIIGEANPSIMIKTADYDKNIYGLYKYNIKTAEMIKLKKGNEWFMFHGQCPYIFNYQDKPFSLERIETDGSHTKFPLLGEEQLDGVFYNQESIIVTKTKDNKKAFIHHFDQPEKNLTIEFPKSEKAYFSFNQDGSFVIFHSRLEGDFQKVQVDYYQENKITRTSNLKFKALEDPYDIGKEKIRYQVDDLKYYPEHNILYIKDYNLFTEGDFGKILIDFNSQEVKTFKPLKTSLKDRFINKIAGWFLGKNYDVKTLVKSEVFKTKDSFFVLNQYRSDLDLIQIPPSVFLNLNNDWKKALRPGNGIKNMLKQLKTHCSRLYSRF